MAGFRVNTNVPALFSQRRLQITNTALTGNLEKLSSGLRINRAADDAAGLAISEGFRTQVNGLKVSSRNIQDGISMIQVAEGGVSEITEQLQRLRGLAVQSGNDTLTTRDRALIQLEFNQLLTEIDRQVSTVNFNTKVLLTGAFSKVTTAGNASVSLRLQVGANKGEQISFNIFTVSTKGLGISGLSVTATQTSTVSLVSAVINTATASGSTQQGVVSRLGAESAITLVNDALTDVMGLRAELGSIQNRLERTFSFVQLQMENQQASESRIRDLDFASEIIDFTKNQILQQAGASALAQANVAPQSVLQLLR